MFVPCVSIFFTSLFFLNHFSEPLLVFSELLSQLRGPSRVHEAETASRCPPTELRHTRRLGIFHKFVALVQVLAKTKVNFFQSFVILLYICFKYTIQPTKLKCNLSYTIDRGEGQEKLQIYATESKDAMVWSFGFFVLYILWRGGGGAQYWPNIWERI
jgi:hypothetical protein